MTEIRKRSPRNRTLSLSDAEREKYFDDLIELTEAVSADELSDKIFTGDLLRQIDFLPSGFVDLMIIDPPYNLSKNFNGLQFCRSSDVEYIEYLESWFPRLLRLLKPDASVYLCCDWQSSSAMYQVMSKYLKIRNRIVWQREKGRGAKSNWKNCSEDIWFGTCSNHYYFNADAVKQKRKVIAPYRHDDGNPKDWEESVDGKYRLTCASNFWDDISIPYWSMPENTDHPTQKPEKLIAKLILASSKPNDMVFDPFMGSGTTAVSAKKLNRRFCGIELNPQYSAWALARLKMAEDNPIIQGYENGVFLERNTPRGR